MDDHQLLVFGGSGVLGSGFLEVADQAGVTAKRVSPPWTESERALRHITQRLPEALGRAPTTVVWAAGIGQVNASKEVMSVEHAALKALCQVLEDSPPDSQRQTRLVFASSAGALFGGFGGGLISQDSIPAPIAPYGWQKLAQEKLCQELAEASQIPVLIARYSNLFGLAGGRLRGKGLIAAAVRAARLRQPICIFVGSDNRRDYLNQRDAARLSIAHVSQLPPGFHTRIIADGRTHTVAEVLGIVGSVVGRRVPATYATRAETALQPRVLRFEPSPAPVVRDAMAMQVTIRRMALASMARD